MAKLRQEEEYTLMMKNTSGEVEAARGGSLEGGTASAKGVGSSIRRWVYSAMC